MNTKNHCLPFLLTKKRVTRCQETLERSGVPPHMLKIVRCFHEGMHTLHLKSEMICSKLYTLSPTLFSL